MGVLRRAVLIAALVGTAICAPPLAVELEAPGSCYEDCNNHGYCHDGACVCYPGFAGETCKYQAECPNNCNFQGFCKDGECKCYPGFKGVDCMTKFCPNACSGHGACRGDGNCMCDKGWYKDDCSEVQCPNDCRDKGDCVMGTCYCKPGFFGDDCGKIKCPADCSGHGTCDVLTGVCYCDKQWMGDSCNLQLCVGCEHGTCYNGTCCCDDDWEGDYCHIRRCPDACSGHGECFGGICRCEAGYEGDNCGTFTCPFACHGADHGNCDVKTHTCECFTDKWVGEFCDTLTCSAENVGGTADNCSGNGICNNGTCICNNGYTGRDCGYKACPLGEHPDPDCSGHGTCDHDTGLCHCERYWEGFGCQFKSCLNDCAGKGYCNQGECICFAGWHGTDCSIKSCPNGCNNQGTCRRGICTCNEGFTGEDCSFPACPDDCMGVGKCVDGACFCPPEFSGASCENRVCPLDCSSNGECDGSTGVCACDPAFRGKACNIPQCPNQCSGNGKCNQTTGKCTCGAGYSGADCSFLSCPNDCSGNGECKEGTCQCDPMFRGADCSMANCPNNCNFNGVCKEQQDRFDPTCIRKQCVCSEKWNGEDCSIPACGPHCDSSGGICDVNAWATMSKEELEKFRTKECCSHHGICAAGKCMCDDTWEGNSCEIPKCKNNCTFAEGSGTTAPAGAQGHCVKTKGTGEFWDGYWNTTEQFGTAKCGCFLGWDGEDCTEPSCPANCNGNGICINGICACFEGYEGAQCEEQLFSKECQCGDRCSDYALGQCQSTFEVQGQDAGKACFVPLTKQCYDKCMLSTGFVETPNRGFCDSRECKTAKRIFIDGTGILKNERYNHETARGSTEDGKILSAKSHESDMDKPLRTYGAKWTPDKTSIESGLGDNSYQKDVTDSFFIGFPSKLDLNQLTEEHGLPAHQLREIITGEYPGSAGLDLSNVAGLRPDLTKKAAAVKAEAATAMKLLESVGKKKPSAAVDDMLNSNVLAQLSAEDRKLMDKMGNKEKQKEAHVEETLLSQLSVQDRDMLAKLALSA